MPSLGESFPAIESALADRYGRGIAPAPPAAPFEAVVAVYLGRTSGEAKVRSTVAALREHGLLDPASLAAIDPAELDDTLRQARAGLAVGARATLQRLARWFADLGDPEAIATEELREALSGLKGVGASTADAILLLALRRPAYPVDRATYRVLFRHGWIDESSSYEEIRSLVEGNAAADPDRLAQLAGWFERIGTETCRTTVARCERCVLRPFLPESGPIEPTT